VRWEETPKGLESRLNGVLIDRFADGENAGYPTLCKGRFDVGDDETYYAIEEPTSLNTLELLPELMKMGVRAIKIEGRQRSPAYVAQVTKVWRAGHRQAAGRPPALQPPSRLDGRAGPRWPKASSTPWAPTTAPGNNEQPPP
jgi:collagenase-like PrtC family protease